MFCFVFVVVCFVVVVVWLDNILLADMCVHFSARTVLQAGVNKAHAVTRFPPVSVPLTGRSNTITATVYYSCVSLTSSVSTKLSWPHSTGLRVSDTTLSIPVSQAYVPARQKQTEDARTQVFWDHRVWISTSLESIFSTPRVRFAGWGPSSTMSIFPLAVSSNRCPPANVSGFLKLSWNRQILGQESAGVGTMSNVSFKSGFLLEWFCL